MKKEEVIEKQVIEIEKVIFEDNDWAKLDSSIIGIINNQFSSDDRTNNLIKTRNILRWVLSSHNLNKESSK